MLYIWCWAANDKHSFKLIQAYVQACNLHLLIHAVHSAQTVVQLQGRSLD
jgi:hypothetical protein